MEEMISVNNLRKEFSYYKKGAGLQGSLNNLFQTSFTASTGRC